jgi:parallel beta-helix repeat protein
MARGGIVMTSSHIVFTLILILVLILSGFQAVTANPEAKTYIVNSDTSAQDVNPGDGFCATAGGNCTLRAAIQEANLDGVDSTIKFASRMTINYPNLPGLSENGTVIDGSDRWNTEFDRPGVEVGAGAEPNGILVIGADSCSVLGLAFLGSESTGIRIYNGNNNIIGGSEQHQRNIFATDGISTAIGVLMEGNGVGNQVINNYFGTIDGTSLTDMRYGIFVRAGGQTIKDNLIVGAGTAGILLWSDDNTVAGNIIGLDKFKFSALPNKEGILVDWGDNNTIGPDNWIMGNTSHGIQVHNSNNTSIFNNEVGDWSTSTGPKNGGNGIHIIGGENNEIGVQGGNDISKNNGYGVYVWYSDSNTVQGNFIAQNGQDGVYIEEGEKNQVGGGGSDQGNLIFDNGGDGVHIKGKQSFGNQVSGNWIGFAATQALAGNLEHGVFLENGPYASTIGGTDPGEGNWINGFNYSPSSAGKHGIFLSGSDTQDNTIVGNVIGMPPSQTWEASVGLHGIAVYDGSHNNFIGTLGMGNTILNAGWSGVAIVESNDNLVMQNKIGTDGAVKNWGNNYFGVDIYNGEGNILSLNEIAYSGTHNGVDEAEAGVRVRGASALFDTITGNSIHNNDGPGIVLADSGNMGLGAPIINTASCGGPVSGTTCAGCTVEIFSDDQEEGRIYETGVVADGSGNFTWSGNPNGPNVTATSTHPAGHTSTFSAPFNIGTCNTAPAAAFSVSPGSGTTSTVFTFDASSSSDAEDSALALSFRWDWENNGIYDTAWSNSATIQHTFTVSGTHTVRLEVKDTGGLTDTSTQQVAVSSGPTPPPTPIPTPPEPQDTKKVYLPLVIK